MEGTAERENQQKTFKIPSTKQLGRLVDLYSLDQGLVAAQCCEVSCAFTSFASVVGSFLVQCWQPRLLRPPAQTALGDAKKY